MHTVFAYGMDITADVACQRLLHTLRALRYSKAVFLDAAHTQAGFGSITALCSHLHAVPILPRAKPHGMCAVLDGSAREMRLSGKFHHFLITVALFGLHGHAILRCVRRQTAKSLASFVFMHRQRVALPAKHLPAALPTGRQHGGTSWKKSSR